MPDLDALKAEAKRILIEGVVDIVIGFKAGDTPLHPQPAFFKTIAKLINSPSMGCAKTTLPPTSPASRRPKKSVCWCEAARIAQ